MNRLKELRKQKGLTQLEFAKAINSAQSTVANWENGVRDIDNDRLKTLADFFDVTIDYLLGRTDAPTPPGKENAPIQDEDLKFALWGPTKEELTDEDLEDVRRYAQFVAERKKQKRDEGKK